MTSSFDIDATVAAIRGFQFRPRPARPRLLFGIEDIENLRQRAAEREGLLERVRVKCRQLLEQSPDSVNLLQTYVSSAEAVTVAEGYVLTGDPMHAEWAKRRVEALLNVETWFAPVHKGGCRVCDHCMANSAAHVALVHDHLGECWSAEESERVAAGVRRLHFGPFLDATGDKPEWWFRHDTLSNWKIMTCGDSGLAVCGFHEHWPEANEALARAAQAVIQVLDDVPTEGDWPEGIGYWFGTLRLGLRFARALRRLTNGEVDLFQHPALKVTGDYAAMLVTPAGGVYHFNDNNPELEAGVTEPLVMLAAEHRRGDWMRVARLAPADSPLFLACDDPAIRSMVPAKPVGFFPHTGVATLRSGWEPNATFIGFKSGPSAVGHSHLDANSFVVEARGRPLMVEQRYWPQAHFLGFFDNHKLRWKFDGMATIGHSSLLVDGQGQTWGHEFPGRIVSVHAENNRQFVVGDASRCYPGLLKKFIRSVLLLGADAIVVRDVVECESERHVEWLLHYAGTIRSEGTASVIENGGVTLSVVPFLPDHQNGWRTSDVERTSTYECSDTRQMVTRAIRYRSFSTFRKAERFEFLFGLRVNGSGASDWRFEGMELNWRLTPSGMRAVVQPDGDSMKLG